ncbi:mechanosensitive ion channel domain-containing protein [Parabacteroides sp. PF5-9]|uniref:mechanosensitive ion channel domain-containing protein n=1 Tax=Parabacteroides sp. PF5-9 TaxID=1742404 RepID=UPI002475515A|nr:mechanosensitive ion channel domain-containing protein [Parabacteroides sp. PF5-9]MDH6358505.1 MscS family membrane protein [Parabacteroides sp. PF5-9]
MNVYIPQIVASGIAVVLLPLSRYVSYKLIVKYGQLIQMPQQRILQVKQVVSILLNILFIFTIAIVWGVQPHNILLGLSSVFAVIGVAFFAQWSILSNITAGLILFFTAPFRVGDQIHIIDKDIPIIATIENIQTFYTHIRTIEGELIVIPNNLFLQKIVSVKKGVDSVQ